MRIEELPEVGGARGFFLPLPPLERDGPDEVGEDMVERPIPLSEVLGEAVRKGFWPTRERLGERFGVVFSKTVVVTETEHV